MSDHSEIVKFWISQKNNWFIPNSERRDKFDQLIKNKYNDLYQSVSDYFIQLVYLETLNDQDFKNIVISYLKTGIQNNPYNNNLDEISLIILLDQFTRHLNRNNVEIIKRNTKIACEIVVYYLDNKSTKSKLSEEVIPWILMPLKHEKRYDECFKYFNLLINYEEIKDSLKNFYHDLLKKSNLDRNYNKVLKSVRENASISELTNFKSILEFIPTNISDPFPKSWFKNMLFCTVKNSYLTNIKPKIVILSLSGGVDSMVSAVLLIRLLRDLNQSIIVKAVHINYHNRETSDLEEKFVSWFCKSINLELYVGHIKNVKRNNCEREFYENITKKIRFDTYKYLINLYRTYEINDCEIFVVLGHNKDDVEENILNNISKMRDIFNLHGMEEKTYYSEFDINVWRPLLNVQKKEIFDFAHENNIPYLVNTTPEWSSRGKMRNTFLPALKEQFGDSMLNSLMYLADTLKSYSKIINENIDKIPIHFNNDTELYIEKIELPMDGWIRLLNKICEKLNTNIPSKKSVKYFTNIINSSKRENVNVRLTKKLNVMIETNKCIFTITN